MNGGEVIFSFESDTKKLDSSIKETGSKFSNLGNIIKGTAIGNLISQGVQKGIEAFKDLGKSSLDAMSDYEQLTGGIDTLFKGSSQTVQKYASEAYKTAGVSANKYMELATSFSASLISSLGGNTDKASKAVNMAIVDMSDNVNKMGSTMESVQNAYQGFAKQNYTMLDNLKLGYGGTKEEMERLLSDAEKISGVHYDIKNLNDVYSAIHVIQEEMGITGTTSKEAEGTISGSIAMVKASFEDLISGEGSPKAFTDSLKTALDNIIPAITKIAPTLVTGITSVINAITPILPGLIEQLLPPILNSITILVSEIVKNLPSILSALWKGITSAFSKLSVGSKAGVGLLGAFIGVTKIAGIIKEIQPLISVFGGLSKVIGIVGTAFKALGAIMLANPIGIIIAIIVALIAVFVVLWNKCEGFRNFWIGLWNGIVAGVVTAFNGLKSGISAIVNGVVNTFWGFINFVGSIPRKIVNAFIMLPRMMANVGSNLVKGLWNGIKDVTGWIIGKIKGFGNSVLKAIKGIFGVHSPSTEFAWIGKMNATGLINGMEGMQPEIQSAIDGMFDLSPNLYNNSSANLSPQVNVYNNVDVSTDPLGQVVKQIKTFSGGSKNDYNYGMGA